MSKFPFRFHKLDSSLPYFFFFFLLHYFVYYLFQLLEPPGIWRPILSPILQEVAGSLESPLIAKTLALLLMYEATFYRCIAGYSNAY